MRVRPAEPDDEAFVVRLVPRFVEHGAADGHTADEVIEGTSRVMRDALRAPREGDVFLVAEDDDGVPAGFVYGTLESDFFTNEPYLHVSEIAVTRSGSGIGAAMMAAVEEVALARGYRFVTLNVVEENRPAQRFYERLGFGPEHRHYVKRIASSE